VHLPDEADADIMLNITPGAEFVTVAKMTTAMIPDVLSDATICDHVYIEGGFKPTIYLSKGAWPMGISPAVDD